MGLLKSFYKEKMQVQIWEKREDMGEAAANDIGKKITELQQKQKEINIIFAAAPSQNEVLEGLAGNTDIDWTKINGFHMDEYIGLSSEAPQNFGNFLRERLFGRVPFKAVYYINGGASDIESECKRYSKLLEEHPIDIVCLGIGENGHIAFNDPGVAEFNDKKIIKEAKLDAVCRQQQVNDGCFKTISDVPTEALTLTIPTLMSGKYLFCTVPARTKAAAVYAMINGGITESCPASILRTHNNASLYCDRDSANKVL
ncbi:MAG: glucosamine-6-phosphate deaminase [Clostridia bacterium]|nr:glucosamine-6-phosphate deaminase [Clostridia bacterium]